MGCSLGNAATQQHGDELAHHQGAPSALRPHTFGHLLDQCRRHVGLELRQRRGSVQKCREGRALKQCLPQRLGSSRAECNAPSVCERGGGELDVRPLKQLEGRTIERPSGHVNDHLVVVSPAVTVEHERLGVVGTLNRGACFTIHRGGALIAPHTHFAEVGRLAQN